MATAASRFSGDPAINVLLSWNNTTRRNGTRGGAAMADTIMTIYEGIVSPTNINLLIQGYKAMVHEHRPMIHDSFLAEESETPTRWRIVTVWRSPEDYQKMADSGRFPGEVVFRSADSEPTLSVWHVVEQAEQP
jgi:hypothetical protein